MLTDARARRESGYSAEDAEGLLQAADAADVKAGLRQATHEAIALGVFGVPWIVVAGHRVPGGRQAFFGSDRLDQVAAILAKPWQGPRRRSGSRNDDDPWQGRAGLASSKL